ncbi:Asp/Glu racemase [Ensifer sp. HO-A22]|uniref:Asp/Glu racemase n=1 Tax=Ensifer oleiphilus TaxID=2742698 RepID=A0A7Y6Q4M3_9HYPH|nr:aspartate/glutamate racemase family protein [Ensifer oleiphilus]NVD38785.1 Asp/Glu racemase [Ensifer oleiphilus]
MIIACLHTADSNCAVFEAAARKLGLASGVLHHTVRPDLLDAAERAGGLTDEIASETAAALSALATHADAVLLTCSTLGPSTAIVGQAPVPVLRIDAALAERAADADGKVVALCAVETTVAPTTALFSEAAKLKGVTFEVRLVACAWKSFKAGDRDGYLAAIAKAADASYDDGASIVALAQASMAGAADLVRRGPCPLTSPEAGLRAALERIAQRAPRVES